MSASALAAELHALRLAKKKKNAADTANTANAVATNTVCAVHTPLIQTPVKMIPVEEAEEAEEACTIHERELLCKAAPTAESAAAIDDAVHAGSDAASAMTRAITTKKTHPVTRDEVHLLRWFRESHPSSLDHCPEHKAHSTDDNPSDVIKAPCTKTGSAAHVTTLSHDRMRSLGMTHSDGSLPSGPDPMPLYWVQAKPEEFKTKFGRWDPVEASWLVHTQRDIVPIERRYAPVKCGAGTDKNGIVKTSDYFVGYDDTSVYKGTGLAPAVECIQKQALQLKSGTMLGAEQGWGTSKLGDALYYTPQLRHVEIDTSVTSDSVADKQFVYGWFGLNLPVQPEPCQGFAADGSEDQPGARFAKGVWNSTNSCWVFPLTDGSLSPSGVIECDTEAERDDDMVAPMCDSDDGDIAC